MNNENKNIGNQIPSNNQNINMQNQIPNNNEFNSTAHQYQQSVNPQSNLNNIPINNNFNPVNSQFINQQPTTQHPINNSQMNNSINQNNLYQQSQINGFSTVNSNLANYNTQQPIYQNQSYINNNAELNKKSNNHKLFLFLGIGIAVFIVIIVLILVLVFRDKKGNINEYEKDTNINQTTDSKNVYSYNGFDFNQISGYVYSEENGALTISNGNVGVLLNVSQVNFDNVKANYTEAIPKLSSYGYVVGESKVDTYSNVDVVTYQISSDESNALYYILAAPNSGYIYEGYVVNINNTIDYSNINEIVKIASNSKYNGNYANYSSDFGMNMDVKDLVKNLKERIYE